MQSKINYARQFAAQNVISEDDLVYTTESDLLDQESEAITQGPVLDAIVN